MNKIQIDLKKLQNNYFDAAIANANIANQSMTHLQNAILTLILAELAFLGVIDLFKSEPSPLTIIASGLLIISAFLFIFGAKSQWNHAIRAARNYFLLSKKVSEFISTTAKEEVEKLPDFLSDKVDGLSTNKNANYLIWLSLLCLLSASVLTLIFLIF